MFNVYVVDDRGLSRSNVRVEIKWEGGGRSKSQTDANGKADFSGNGGIASGIYVLDRLVRPGPVFVGYRKPLSVVYSR